MMDFHRQRVEVGFESGLIVRQRGEFKCHNFSFSFGLTPNFRCQVALPLAENQVWINFYPMVVLKTQITFGFEASRTKHSQDGRRRPWGEHLILCQLVSTQKSLAGTG
jgi:hypothetical protein